MRGMDSLVEHALDPLLVDLVASRRSTADGTIGLLGALALQAEQHAEPERRAEAERGHERIERVWSGRVHLPSDVPQCPKINRVATFVVVSAGCDRCQDAYSSGKLACSSSDGGGDLVAAPAHEIRVPFNGE